MDYIVLNMKVSNLTPDIIILVKNDTILLIEGNSIKMYMELVFNLLGSEKIEFNSFKHFDRIIFDDE